MATQAALCVGSVAIGAVALTTVTPASSQEYVVGSGDTLSLIAEQFGLSTSDLAAANSIENLDLIIAGSRLDIPGTVAVAPDAHEHIVEAGDTLSQMALDHQVSVEQLLDWNPVAGERGLWVGDAISFGQTASNTTTGEQVPGSGLTASPPASPQSPPVTAQSASYVVVDGDTLSGIAANHGVSLARLLGSNALTADSIIGVGQQLTIPTVATNLPVALATNPDKLAMMPLFDDAAQRYGVPHDLIKALTWFESGWNNSAVSSADAIGIGQILPVTADFINNNLLGGTQLDPNVPADNIELTAAYLRYLLAETDNNRLAVASYYQGLTAVRRAGIFASSEFYVDGILDLRQRFL